MDDVEANWDDRPLPTGWSLGFDEESQTSCYFHYDTSPPTISYIHPLDIDTGVDPSQMSSAITGRGSSRPLPQPPAQRKPSLSPPSPSSPVPAYSALPPLVATTLASPPSPKKAPRQTIPMQNNSAKLSAAQQLYASSFASYGPSVPSLPPPSLRGQGNNSEQQSLYKNHVASYVQPSPPLQRPRSPASTISSLSSSTNLNPTQSPRMNSLFEPLSLPYPERERSVQGSRKNHSPMNTRPHTSSGSHPRGQIELDPYARMTNSTATFPNPQLPPRSLFDLKYVSTGGNKPRQVRNVTTAVKPPSNTAGPGVPQTTNVMLSQTSLNPVSPPPGVLGVPTSPPGATTLTPSVSIPPTQHVGTVASPPPPPNVQQPTTLIPSSPLPNNQSQYQYHSHQQQQAPISPAPPQSPPLQQQQHPHYAQQNTHPQHVQQNTNPQHVQQNIHSQYAQQHPHAQQPSQQQPPHPQQHPQQHSQQYSQQQPEYLQQHPQQHPLQPLRPQQQQPPRPPQTPQTSTNPNPANPPKPSNQSNGLMNNFGSAFATSFGKTAGQIGAQALMSGLGIEDEDDENGGILDSITSGFAELTTGDGGGDAGGGGEPAGGGEYVPPPTDPCDYGAIPPSSDPNIYYADPGAATTYPPQPTGAESSVYPAQTQFSTSYSFEIEYNRQSSGGGGGGGGGSGGGHNGHNGHNGHHGGNTNGHTQTNTQWNPYPNQGNLPTGAQQPYRPQQSMHTIPNHQVTPSGWNPYYHQ